MVKPAAKPATNEVFVQGYLVTAKGSEVLRRLEAAFSTLKEIEQADHEQLPAGLENVAADVIQDAFLKAKSKVGRPLRMALGNLYVAWALWTSTGRPRETHRQSRSPYTPLATGRSHARLQLHRGDLAHLRAYTAL